MDWPKRLEGAFAMVNLFDAVAIIAFEQARNLNYEDVRVILLTNHFVSN